MLKGYNPDKYIVDAFPEIKRWDIEFSILTLEYNCVVNLQNAIIADYMEEAIYSMMVENNKAIYLPLEKLDLELFVDKNIEQISELIYTIEDKSFDTSKLKHLSSFDCLFRLFRCKNELDEFIKKEDLKIPYYDNGYSDDLEIEKVMEESTSEQVELNLSEKELEILYKLLFDDQYLKCTYEDFNNALIKKGKKIIWHGKQNDFAFFCSCFGGGIIMNSGMENHYYKLIAPKFLNKKKKEFKAEYLSSQTSRSSPYFQNLMKKFFSNISTN